MRPAHPGRNNSEPRTQNFFSRPDNSTFRIPHSLPNSELRTQNSELPPVSRPSRFDIPHSLLDCQLRTQNLELRTSMMRFPGVEGKPEMERRAHTRLAFHPDLPFVRIHHVLDDLCSQASAALLGADRLRREEAVSNP